MLPCAIEIPAESGRRSLACNDWSDMWKERLSPSGVDRVLSLESDIIDSRDSPEDSFDCLLRFCSMMASFEYPPDMQEMQYQQQPIFTRKESICYQSSSIRDFTQAHHRLGSRQRKMGGHCRIFFQVKFDKQVPAKLSRLEQPAFGNSQFLMKP